MTRHKNSDLERRGFALYCAFYFNLSFCGLTQVIHKAPADDWNMQGGINPEDDRVVSVDDDTKLFYQKWFVSPVWLVVFLFQRGTTLSVKKTLFRLLSKEKLVTTIPPGEVWSRFWDRTRIVLRATVSGGVAVHRLVFVQICADAVVFL